mgnify:CR=1 FL=1
MIINFHPKILWYHPKIMSQNNEQDDMNKFLSEMFELITKELIQQFQTN